MKNKPVLLTGSHRSGSTWAGKMLSLSPEVGYIHEPFNPAIKGGVLDRYMDTWFKRINVDESGEYVDLIARVIEYHYPYFRNLRECRTLQDLARVHREQYRFFTYKKNDCRPLVKDPIALLSAEWLEQTFDMRVVVLVRHPAAFCASLKRMQWNFDFNEFLLQPNLMNELFLPFSEVIEEYAGSIKTPVEQGALLWNVFHYAIDQYRQLHPDWIFCRHEDLSQDPVFEFKALYTRLELEFSPDIESKILASTSQRSPRAKGTDKYHLQRDSRENITSWKSCLSESEIKFVKSNTEAISSLFYSDSEW
jgi:hypothetical protein